MHDQTLPEVSAVGSALCVCVCVYTHPKYHIYHGIYEWYKTWNRTYTYVAPSLEITRIVANILIYRRIIEYPGLERIRKDHRVQPCAFMQVA